MRASVARPSAAHRSVRNAEAAACLEHRPAARHAHASTRIVDRYGGAPAALDKAPDFARTEHRGEQHQIHQHQRVAGASHHQALGEFGHTCFLHHPIGIGGKRRDLAAHRDEPKAREHRQQHRKPEERIARPLPRRPMTEGEIQAETSVKPPGREQSELPALVVGTPEVVHHAGVFHSVAVDLESESRRYRMADEQHRDAEAERDAQDLGGRDAQRAPFVHREKREREVRRGGAIEKQRARQAVPEADGDSQSGLGHLERNKPEGVIDQMRSHIDKQHHTGAKPQVAAGEGKTRRLDGAFVILTRRLDGAFVILTGHRGRASGRSANQPSEAAAFSSGRCDRRCARRP